MKEFIFSLIVVYSIVLLVITAVIAEDMSEEDCYKFKNNPRRCDVIMPSRYIACWLIKPLRSSND